MDTQAERRNEVMGVARDLRRINTALTAGAIADRMAEQGQKTFTQLRHQTHYQLNRYTMQWVYSIT